MSENIVLVPDNNYTAESFSWLLNGREYREEITKNEELIAKANNLVVCFGASDDLLEFRGAIDEELSAWQGAFTYLINGKVFDDGELAEDLDVLRKYGFMESKPKETIEAIWCPDGLDASWLIKINGFESASFDVMEDDRLYCRGAVFQLK